MDFFLFFTKYELYNTEVHTSWCMFSSEYQTYFHAKCMGISSLKPVGTICVCLPGAFLKSKVQKLKIPDSPGPTARTTRCTVDRHSLFCAMNEKPRD